MTEYRHLWRVAGNSRGENLNRYPDIWKILPLPESLRSRGISRSRKHFRRTKPTGGRCRCYHYSSQTQLFHCRSLSVAFRAQCVSRRVIKCEVKVGCRGRVGGVGTTRACAIPGKRSPRACSIQYQPSPTPTSLCYFNIIIGCCGLGFVCRRRKCLW